MDKMLRNKKYFIKDDFKIEINNVSEIPPHTHDFIEFVYMLKGTSVHTVDDKEYSMSRGDLLIVNYNQIHSFNGDNTAEFCNILIKPSFIDKSIKECTDLFTLFETSDYKDFKELIDKNCNFIKFSPEEKNCFEYMLLLLNKELTHKKIGYALTTQAGLNFLLTLIFRRMCDPAFEKNDFNQALDYIKKNYNQNITVNDLSKMCHYNPSYFSRVFKKYTGITFSEYLKIIRISKACRLIDDSNIKMNDIYIMVGYTNKTNFYKHFRQITNTTPLKYKNRDKRP